MPISKEIFKRHKTTILLTAGILLLFALASLFLHYHPALEAEASGALSAKIYFDGEYRIGNGPWQKITEGEHISATKGDVTLRGNFHCLNPEGAYDGLFSRESPLAFYSDHINIVIIEDGAEPYVIDNENPLSGAACCGQTWTVYHFTSPPSQPVEMLLHNPHRYGNETAIDALLGNLILWGSVDSGQELLKAGTVQRNLGMLLMIIAQILFGIALFAALLRLSDILIFLLSGAVTFFAGLYLAYSISSASFWNDSAFFNTSMHGFSMIFYLLFICVTITHCLQKQKKLGILTTVTLVIADGLCLALPMLTELLFYDALLFWVIAQTAANILLLYALCREAIHAERKKRLLYAGLTLPLIAFELDALFTANGFLAVGILSECTFCTVFFAMLFVILYSVPARINAAERAKALELQNSRMEAEKNRIEAELKESRISLMLSQIQPHFIYNTLGTIERMCLKDPQKAFAMVRDFSMYLRGNFSEIDSILPIPFAKEMDHVTHYVNIESVRFPDISITYELEATDFTLPALSVQPLVENAIKHGLMHLETGGSILVRSYETPEHYCVEVIDDGVGFDPGSRIDEKKHIGIRNIRGRLAEMVDGTLTIERGPGSGTRAVIMIPKEVIV